MKQAAHILEWTVKDARQAWRNAEDPRRPCIRALSPILACEANEAAFAALAARESLCPYTVGYALDQTRNFKR